jgi:hypothetical protein
MLEMMLLSHAGDDVTGATWPRRNVDTESCWRWCCQVMLVTMLSGRLGRGAMKMLSHGGDDAARATWPRRVVAIKSYWRRCC